MRLIDADELADMLSRIRRKLDHKEYYTPREFHIRDFMLLNFEQIVRNSTTIDPVKHGLWISVNDSLPENGEHLVVAYSPKTHNSNKVMIMKARNLRVRAEKGWSTYWVPIPDLPLDEDIPTENAEATT